MFDSCLDLDCLWKALPLSQVSQQPHSGWLSIVQKASKDPAGDIFSASIKLLVWFHLSPPSDCSAKGWGFIFLRRKTLSVQPSESRAQWQVCALQLQWTLVQTRVLLSAKLYHTVCCEATTRCKDAEQSVGRTQCSGMMQWDDDALLWCSRCALLGWRRCAIALVGKHCIGVPMVALFLGMMIWWWFDENQRDGKFCQYLFPELSLIGGRSLSSQFPRGLSVKTSRFIFIGGNCDGDRRRRFMIMNVKQTKTSGSVQCRKPPPSESEADRKMRWLDWHEWWENFLPFAESLSL